MPRTAYGSGPLFDLAAFTTVALFSHIIFGGIFASVVHVFFGDRWSSDLLAVFLGEKLAAVLHLGYDHFLLLGTYATFVCAMAWLSGYWTIQGIERQWWLFGRLRPLTHGIFFDVVTKRNGQRGFTFVYVLTTTTYQNRYMMYSGLLEEIGFQSGKKISYIAISEASRFLMKIKDDTPDIQEQKYFMDLDANNGLPSILIIPADRIINVAFRPIPVFVR